MSLPAVDVAGFSGFALQNESLEAKVLPGLGGKIVSLVGQASEREWLWRNPHLALRAAEPGDSYAARHDTGGIDECLPEVHGELWSRPWRVEVCETDHDGAQILSLSVRGARQNYKLRRTLRLGRGNAPLEIDYELHNQDERELDFVWCLHALCAVTPGMWLELPHATPLRIEHAHGPAPAKLERMPDPAKGPRFAAKYFAGPLAQGRAGLRSADGREALRFRFDAA
jgi:hypothetical protein